MSQLSAFTSSFILTVLLAGANAWSQPLDVVVPPPGSPSGQGALTVVGEPGLSQGGEYEVFQCAPASDGGFARGSCYFLFAASLHETVQLNAGHYRIVYERTFTNLEIGQGDSKILQLQKIQVPQQDAPVRYTVFWDLTHPSMQNLYARSTWESARYASEAGQICAGPYHQLPGGRYFCTTWLSGKYSDFKQNVFSFDNQAGFTALAYVAPPPQFQRRYFGRFYATSPTDSEFVSVFPGIYGLRFQYETGRIEDVYGVDVK